MPLIKRGLASGAVLVALLASTSVWAASTTTYSYDALGQLIAVTSTAGRSSSYTYDTAGNRTNMSATGAISLNAPTTGTCSSAVACPDSFRNMAPPSISPLYAEEDGQMTTAENRKDWEFSEMAGVKALR